MSTRTLELAILLLVVIYFFAWFPFVYNAVGPMIHSILALIVIIAVWRIMQGKQTAAK